MMKPDKEDIPIKRLCLRPFWVPIAKTVASGLGFGVKGSGMKQKLAQAG